MKRLVTAGPTSEGQGEVPPRRGARNELLHELSVALDEAFTEHRARPGANLPVAEALIDGALVSARTELIQHGEESLRGEIPNLVHLLVLVLADPDAAERARGRASRRLAAAPY